MRSLTHIIKCFYKVYGACFHQQYVICPSHHSFFKIWSIVALQCCVGSCHTGKWISCRYTHSPSFLDCLPILGPRGASEIYSRFSLVTYFTHAKSLQSCLALCNPMNCSLPGSSVHRILQARILEQVIGHALRPGISPPQGSNWVS